MLFSTALKANPLSLNQDLYDQARVALSEKKLAEAEHLIARLNSQSVDDVSTLYLAAQIAEAQTKQANFISQTYYFYKVKKHYIQILNLNPKHTESIIGLIRFHQQAPVMAGADKQSIQELFQHLSTVDAKVAFVMQAPKLLEKNAFESVEQMYLKALNSPSKMDKGQFQFDVAMWFSAYGHFQKALTIMQSIDVNKNGLNDESLVMRHYQLAKLSAESQSQFDVGLKHIQRYANFPSAAKTIPQDWIRFRMAQLEFLNNQGSRDKTELLAIRSTTDLDELKDKIDSFLSQY
ncbi:hypothetical protein OS175_00535 [Marinicella sp. S1101]|uniref:hypothetical protein n=1 Tax=Marinicella marina TaxID=2996016 RepID=UPI002260A4CE|nr:hypothetical protein [Marinicella marina]MCX7552348.1 hypothetical protein [Marinicella marina]MDJ1139223.1 hypothetical protein [Marinicella marina]